MCERPDILLAETESAVLDSLEIILEEENYSCRTANSIEEMFDAIREKQPDLIIADITILHQQLDEFISFRSRRKLQCPVLVTLSYEQIADLLPLIKCGISEYLLKPFLFDDLLNRIPFLLHAYSSKKTNNS